MTDFLKQYLKLLTSQYPAVQKLDNLEARFTNLISAAEVQLPLSVYHQISSAIKKIYAHAHSDLFLNSLKAASNENELEILNSDIKNHSVLMAYDFHFDYETKRISLIEINTNASAFLIVDQIYKNADAKEMPWGNALNNLKQSFQEELRLAGVSAAPKIAIVDENIIEQKMYAEFLMYKQLFESWGWESSLHEQAHVPLDQFHFIYNRSTDFLFSRPDLQYLREAFCTRRTVFSPQPKEYLLLAAKNRLIDFSKENISDLIPQSFELKSHADHEEVWANRKNLFFKPMRSFGSKGAYKGNSISRKAFDGLLNQDFLAQEYCPPGKLDAWKFDLRFYAYKDQIQLGAARIYQGQVTNFNLPGGGLSRLTFV